MIPTTLYFAPHQDDELLTMGNAIIESVKKEDTHIILCTDGSKSSIRKKLNDDGTCSYHVGVHKYEMNEEEFSKSRDNEFEGSCEALGIDEDNIHLDEDRVSDGALTKEEAKKIILKYLDKYPDAKVNTISPYGGEKKHKDHIVLGEAAIELYNEGIIKELNLYIEPYEVNDVDNLNIDVKYSKLYTKDEEKLSNAIKSYSEWKPEDKPLSLFDKIKRKIYEILNINIEAKDNRRYAIGYHSVKDHFELLKKEKTTYIHKP